MNRRHFLISASALVGAAGLGVLGWQQRWEYIVVHHSAGSYADIAFLQQVHRERQAHDPVDAIPYHYVIGNGNGLGEGEVASDWRQEYGIWGAHVSARNLDHNFRGLGVCAIGNFDQHPMAETQYQALLGLIKRLMHEHAIPANNVNGHGLISGESTRCPGKHFPLARLQREIRPVA